jgi:hypothetical protein
MIVPCDTKLVPDRRASSNCFENTSPTASIKGYKDGFACLQIPCYLNHHIDGESFPILSLLKVLIDIKKYRNFNLLSIGYPFIGLTLGPTYPTLINIGSETLGFRRPDFSSGYVTHTGILTSCRSTIPHGYGFTATRTLPYHTNVKHTSAELRRTRKRWTTLNR